MSNHQLQPTFRHGNFSHLKHLGVSPYNYLQSTFRCSYIFALKTSRYESPSPLDDHHLGVMAFLHLKHLGVGPYHHIQLIFRCSDFFPFKHLDMGPHHHLQPAFSHGDLFST